MRTHTPKHTGTLPTRKDIECASTPCQEGSQSLILFSQLLYLGMHILVSVRRDPVGLAIFATVVGS